MKISKSHNVVYAQDSYQQALKIVKTSEYWLGNYQTRVSDALLNLKQYFESINDQFEILGNAIEKYESIQEKEKLVQNLRREYEMATDQTSRDIINQQKAAVNEDIRRFKVNLNYFLSQITSLDINYSNISSSKTNTIFDLYTMLVDSDALEEIIAYENKCIDYLEDAKNEIDKIISDIENNGFSSNYPFPKAKSTTIKNNITKLINTFNRLTNSINRFKETIENYEDGKNVELHELPTEENADTYTATQNDTLESIAQHYNMSPEDLYNVNSEVLSNSNGQIVEGMTLNVPGVLGTSSTFIEAASINSNEYDVSELQGLKPFDQVTDAIWNIDCEPTNLNDLSSPLKNDLIVTCLPSKQVLDNDYDHAKYVDNGNYYNNVRPGHYHYGTDFRATGENVYSISNGIVVYSGNEYGTGTVVVLNEVQNSDGTVSYYRTRYEHLTWGSVGSNGSIKAGEIVTPNTKIGVSGNTGTSQYHLHVDVAKTTITEDEIAKCNTPADIVRLYNSKTSGGINSNKVTDMDSFIDVGSYYIETGKAKNNASHSTTNK